MSWAIGLEKREFAGTHSPRAIIESHGKETVVKGLHQTKVSLAILAETE